LLPLAQAEALTREPGLLLGALARERRLAAETALAEAMGDDAALLGMEAIVRRRLAAPGPIQPLDWAADQIAMAHFARARARLAGTEPHAVGLMLAEAIETAREHGAPALAQRALLAMPAMGEAL
jgi:hypothetical protein